MWDAVFLMFSILSCFVFTSSIEVKPWPLTSPRIATSGLLPPLQNAGHLLLRKKLLIRCYQQRFWFVAKAARALSTLAGPVLPLRKFYAEQMFVFVRMQPWRHNQWSVASGERSCDIYIRYLNMECCRCGEWYFTALMVWCYLACAP